MIFIIVIVCCLFMEAFFSSSEIAIVSADRSQIRQWAEKEQLGAKYVEDFLKRPHRFMATTLLGTQFFIVMNTVVSTLWLYRVAPEHARLYLMVGLTPMVVIFGEVVPKAIVRQHATWLAPKMAIVLHGMTKIFYPLVTFLTGISERFSQRMGIDLRRKLVLREELESLVTPHKEKNQDLPISNKLLDERSDVTEHERSMIARIFELSELTVEDIRVPLSGLVAMPDDATIEELISEIADKKYSRIPIYHERLDQVVGIVHAFDVFRSSKASLKALDIMRKPVFVPQSKRAVDLLIELQDTKQNMVVVVDEYGGAVGVATVEDILEQVIGDIEDEFDIEKPIIRKEKENVYVIPGSLSIEQLNEELNLEIPLSEDYESIGGFILETLGRIPKSGELFIQQGCTIEVVLSSERKIELVRIIVQPGKK